MKKFCLMLWMIFCTTGCRAGVDARQQIITWMENAGMHSWLDAPVEITQTRKGTLSIRDRGIFAFQYALLNPDIAAEPNIVFTSEPAIPPTVQEAVVITHGWLDKGADDWPAEMAWAIAQRTDPNQWLCISYDWRGGSAVVSSIQAAEYARDIAGPRLAKALFRLGIPFHHIHLIGHSAGSWAIHSAAQLLAEQDPGASFQMTFLDAYVPSKWNPDELGDIFPDAASARVYWADHYFTRDITASVTQYDLKRARNLDITDLDPWIAEHEFPYRWYYATITGRYTRWDEKKEDVISQVAGIQYGFERSREAGESNWTESLSLPMGNEAIKMRKPSD